MTVDRMTWVWTDEVMEVVRRRMRAEGLSAGELARRAAERFGLSAASFERQWRDAQGADGVMRVHRADLLLVLVDSHLTDLPCYRAAMRGELAPEQWPVRGRRRPSRRREPAAASPPAHPRRAPAREAAAWRSASPG